MRVGILGVTGLVGTKMLEVLDESKLPIEAIIPIASEKSKGKIITFQGKNYEVVTPEEGLENHPMDVALFSAGGSTSLYYAPLFNAKGIFVIDNSSAWRMAENIPLAVLEVNANILSKDTLLIANPNCSTIQLVVVLKALQDVYGLERVVVSTYQSVTGTGVKAVAQLMDERQGIEGEKAYPYTIDMNCLPQVDVFLEDGYTKEELKVIQETRKILGLPNLAVTCTAVRVPVMGGHSESVNITLSKPFEVAEVKELLSQQDGVIVYDNPKNLEYPMPILTHNRDEIFVGRIRRDDSYPNTLNLWIVADNLRKGAATNAVQILGYLHGQGFID